MSAAGLPFKNLTRKPGRTWALVLLTAFLSLSLFAGSVVVMSLQSGLRSLEARLGADIIVVPAAAKTKTDFQNILLQGTTGAFYMDAGLLDQIAAAEGVEKAAPQTFLATLKADCCSSRLQVIGIDQQADFTVQPWIAQSSSRELGPLEVAVGSDISAGVGDTLRIYRQSCPVVARLSPTGTGLDTAVYCSMETMKTLLEAAEEMGVSHKVTSDNAEEVISAVYVKVAEGASVDQVATSLMSHPRWKVAVVQTRSMITDVSDGLAGVASAVKVLIGAVWALSFVILLVVFALLTNERKREFAVLRLIGASRRSLRRLILTETGLVCLLGGCLGIAVGAAVIFLFTALIESALGLPYLTPDGGKIALVAVLSLLGTALMGALASARTAWHLSRVDTGSILREGN